MSSAGVLGLVCTDYIQGPVTSRFCHVLVLMPLKVFRTLKVDCLQTLAVPHINWLILNFEVPFASLVRYLSIGRNITERNSFQDTYISEVSLTARAVLFWTPQ